MTVSKPGAVLIFPPLIKSNFGEYYPATAVLAAFLGKHGYESLQLDLNERFAEHLLAPATLARAT